MLMASTFWGHFLLFSPHLRRGKNRACELESAARRSPIRSFEGPSGIDWKKMNQAKATVPKWRLTTTADLKIIDEIADRIHTGLPERSEVFAEKRALFPNGCLALQIDDRVVGYGFFHPWMIYQIPPLDSFLERVPKTADCLYVHDVVVLPEYRGHGAVGQYVKLISVRPLRMVLQRWP